MRTLAVHWFRFCCASRKPLVLVVSLVLALHPCRVVGGQGTAKLRISANVNWNSNTQWGKELKDSDDKPYRAEIAASEGISLANEVVFEMEDGSWTEKEGKPNITVSGTANFVMTGKNPINKSVNSVAQEPIPTNGMVRLKSLDFEEGYAVVSVTKPSTTTQPECFECGFIALLAVADCMAYISTNNTNPRPEEYRLEFAPGNKEFSASRTFNWTESSPCGSESITASFTISYTPGQWEAVILPPQDFDQWKPVGGLDGSEPGTSLGVTVQLRHKGEKEVATDATGFFYVTLEDVSRQPGVCVNAPPKDEANTDPDLQLAETDEFWLSDEEGLGGETAEEVSELSFNIDCYDFGAYGRLRVQVKVSDGTTLYAHQEADPGKDYLDIPVDDNHNHLADIWEKDNQVPEGLPPTWDEADQPAGQSTLGDGISLFEKYRGFFVKGGHQRLNPHKKYLFIYDPTGWAQLSTTEPDGVSLIKALDCEVVFIEDKYWTGPGGSGSGKRVVNFNSTDEVHATDQHALHLRFPFTDNPLYPTDYNDMLVAKGRAKNTDAVDALGLTFPDLSAARHVSPAGWMAVEIYANNIEKWTRSAALYHTLGLPEFAPLEDPATSAADKDRLNARAKTLTDEYISQNSSAYEKRNWKIFTATITHETGHGLGVKDLLPPNFFGPSNCVMRYFQWAARPDPNDRFELAARVPWPDIYCLDPTGTKDGIACWKQICVTDRPGAIPSPALLSFASHQHGDLQLASQSMPRRSQITQVAPAPNLALTTELLWPDPLAGTPLRVGVSLSSSAYQAALALAQETGQPVPTNILRPTVRSNWYEGLYVTLYARSNSTFYQLFDNSAWQGFFRPETVSAASFGQKSTAQSREWLVPINKLVLQPGEYMLSVLWDGDGMVEKEALPAVGYVSAKTLNFEVTAPTNSLQLAVREHRLAFEAYTSGNYQSALDHALAAIQEKDARQMLQTEGTHMIAANAATKLKNYRTAAAVLQDQAVDGRGELAEMALNFRRALAPEIVIDPSSAPSSSRNLTVIGLPGETYEVQASLDLAKWTTVDRRLSTTNRYEVVDATGSPEQKRFYRVVW